MTNKRLKTTMDEQLTRISVSAQLAEKILALPQAAGKMKKRTMLIITVCGALLIAVTGFAAANPGFQRLLSMVSDRVVQLLQPIELASESGGVRMEVVAAMCDERNAAVYFSLQDLEGGRLDGLIDPYDFFLSGTRAGSTSAAPYDKETQTAMLRVLAYGGEKTNGQKVTFSLRSFLAGRTKYENIPIGLPLDTIQTAEHTRWLADGGIGLSGSAWIFDEMESKGGLALLPPDGTDIPIPDVDFARISNIGLVNGRLHVQIRWTKKGQTPDSPNIDDHGHVSLVGKDGGVLGGDTASFCIDAQGEADGSGYNSQGLLNGGGSAYEEIIFPPIADLSEYTLQGEFYSNKAYITGDWSVTFRLQAVKAYKQAECDIDIGSARIHTVTVSPMGWTILGEKGTPDAAVQAQVLVQMTDGAQERFEVSDTISDETSFEYHSFADQPLDISRIEAVYVNGLHVELTEKR